MSLPSGYAQVEYIEGTGSQYINTGFTPKSTTQTIMDCYVAVVNTSDNARIFGVRSGSSTKTSKGYALLLLPSGNWYIYHGSNNSQLATNGVGRVAINRNANTCSITSSTGTVTLTATASTFTADYPMLLFSMNNAGEPGTPAAMKLYSCQIYDVSTLVRNYIPCVSSSGEVGLWDDVNSVVYVDAAGVGFVAGPYLVPDTPGNFTATASNGVITLSWSTSAGASGYRLYRDGALIADTTELSYSDAVEFGATYSYQVVAYNSGGDSSAATVSISTPPNAPTDFLAANADNVVTLSWSAVQFATGYRLYRDGTLLADTARLSFEDTINYNQNYIYGIAAYNGNGESVAKTLDVYVPYVPPAPPSMPTNFSAIAGIGHVLLSWSAAEYAQGYRIYRDGSVVYDGTALGFDDTGIANDVTYTYTLAAYNVKGETTLSLTATPGLYLITDRTEADTKRLLALSAKDYATMTSEERKEWDGIMKGAYSAADLNRVGEAVAFVNRRVRESGYKPTPAVSPKTDWTDEDNMSAAQRERYISDIKSLRGAMPLPLNTPKAPDDLDDPTLEEANNIEKILLAINSRVNKLTLGTPLCGEAVCEEGNL